MATYQELSGRNDSEKIVAADIQFIQTIANSNITTYSTYYKVNLSDYTRVSGIYYYSSSLGSISISTVGTSKDTLTSGQHFWENGILYFCPVTGSPLGSADIYIKRNLYVATSYVVKKSGMTTGSLTVFEPRLKSVPSFSRKIDPIDNTSLVLGSYSIKLQNVDNYYSDLVRDNWFKNQPIKLYSIINPQEIDDSEILNLATGYITEISVDETDITIKISENNPLKNGLTNPITADGNSSYLLGIVKNAKYEYINDPLISDYIYSGLNVNMTSDLTNGSRIKYTSSPIDLLRLLRTGHRIALGNVSTSTPSDLYKGVVRYCLLDDSLLTSFPIVPGVNATFKLYVHKEDLDSRYSSGLVINDRYAGSASVSEDLLNYIKVSVSANMFKDQVYIPVSESLSYLQSGDLIWLQGYIPPLTAPKIQVTVDYFDSVNNRIYIKEQMPFDTLAPSINSYVIVPRISSITLNEKLVFKNNQFKLFMTPAGYNSVPASGTSAYITIDYNLGGGIPASKKYVIWFKAGTSTAPTVSGTTAYLQVTLASGDTNLNVITKIQNAILADSTFRDLFYAMVDNTTPSNLYLALATNPLVLPRISMTNATWNVGYVDGINITQPFTPTFSPSTGISLTFNKAGMAVNNPEGARSQGTGGISGTGTGGVSNPKIDRRLTASSADYFKEVKEGDYIYISLLSDTPLLVTEVDPDNNRIYIDRYLSTALNVTGEWIVYKGIEYTSDLKLTYSGVITRPHYSEIAKNMLNNIYNIPDAKIDTTALTSIKTNYPFLYMGLIIDEEQNLFNSLNLLNKSSSLISYTDRTGKISCKFINFNSLGSTSNIIYKTDLLKYTRSLEDNILNSIIYKYNKNIDGDTYEGKTTISNPNSTLVALCDIREVNEVESSMVYANNVSSNNTYMSAKFFRTQEKAILIGNLSLSRFEVGDLVKLSGFSNLSNSDTYIILEVKTDGFVSQIEIMRFLNQF